MKLEKRMYGLVPYNISPIQQGIQFGHAVVEYSELIRMYEANIVNYPNKSIVVDEYNEWANLWKTFIILNGGTTNDKCDLFTNESEPIGTLNKHHLTLINNNVELATFREVDLGNQLTAIVFIVDERVFNKTKYPDFDKFHDNILLDKSEVLEYGDIYDRWVRSVGGNKNVFLRDFLSKFRLA